MKKDPNLCERTVHQGFAKHVQDAIRAKAGNDTGEPVYADALLEDALIARATDIHISHWRHGARIRFRVDGAMIDILHLEDDEIDVLINQIKALSDINPVTLFTRTESRFQRTVDGKTLDLRVELMPSIRGEAINIRMLVRDRIRSTMTELGLSEAQLDKARTWLDRTQGLFAVTGPTGSGKTTTLYALLHELRVMEKSVLTIEDPVEYQVDGVTQIQVDLDHELTFSEGTKAVLRLDPDYILVGEMREAASANAACDGALTGRPVMTTLHARDAVSTISVLRNFELDDFEIANALSFVINQRLVRTLCPLCRSEVAPTSSQSEWFEAARIPVPDTLYEPTGCSDCNGIGYLGRTALFELWNLLPEDSQAILDHISEIDLRHQLRERGHQLLVHDAVSKLQNGTTSFAEVRFLGGLNQWQ